MTCRPRIDATSASGDVCIVAIYPHRGHKNTTHAQASGRAGRAIGLNKSHRSARQARFAGAIPGRATGGADGPPDNAHNTACVEFADFQPALFAATVMNAFERPWCVAGGWAIDLWLGRATRNHQSVEVAVLRDDQLAVRAFLQGWPFAITNRDGTRRKWSPTDRQMLMLPVQELHATDPRSRRGLGIFLNESDSVDWFYGRDRRIRWPLDQWTVRGAFGVPVLAPHIVLLYKSRSTRPQDHLDLRSALPQLDSELKSWLSEAIALDVPGHPWLSLLRSQ